MLCPQNNLIDILKILAEQNVDINCKTYEGFNGFQVLTKRFSDST
jgi:hypothetical protein